MSGDRVVDTLFQTRDTFLEAGLKPPSIIALSTHDEGIRLVSELEEMHYPAPRPFPSARVAVWRPISLKPPSLDDIQEIDVKTVDVPHGGKHVHDHYGDFMQIDLFDMKVRWPAKQMALPNGKTVWY